MTDLEITTWAERFWTLAGRTEPFPRSLQSAIAWALPIAVVRLPHLGVNELRIWLLQRGIPFHYNAPNRQLRACLLAKAGHGVIFIDGSDSEDDQRFSLAHEVAHFLLDYLEPRERALEVLGKDGREVLDCKRPPTPEERLKGVLKGIQLGTYIHMLDRFPAGNADPIQTLRMEDRADRLAIELLAPASEVLRRLKKKGISWRQTSAFKAAQETLIHEFGIPAEVAERYGKALVMVHRSNQTFREWLGSESGDYCRS